MHGRYGDTFDLQRQGGGDLQEEATAYAKQLTALGAPKSSSIAIVSPKSTMNSWCNDNDSRLCHGSLDDETDLAFLVNLSSR